MEEFYQILNQGRLRGMRSTEYPRLSHISTEYHWRQKKEVDETLGKAKGH